MIKHLKLKAEEK